MKVHGGQEASLESSKGFCRVSRSLLTDVSIHAPKFMRIHEIFEKTWKSMKIAENLWKSWNPKKSIKCDEIPQTTRSQPGIEQRFLKGQWVVTYRCKHSCPEINKNLWKSMKIHKSTRKSLKIFENQWKSQKIYKIRWRFSEDKKPRIEQRFLRVNRSLLTDVSIHVLKCIKINEKP